MKSIRLAPLALAALLLPTHLAAAPVTGRNIHEWIEESRTYNPKTDDTPLYRTGKLHGYVIGLADTLTLGRQICLPKGMGSKELLEVIAKRVEHDYEGRSQLATPRITGYLRQTYPCAVKQKRQGKEQPI